MADGEKLATIWIATTELTEDETLEFVPGSFRGPIYDHGVTSLGRPLPPSNIPKLPDIQAEREKRPIV